MATLQITATHNYTGETLDPDDPINQIAFATSALATATFASNQFGTGDNLISNSVAITGDAFNNRIQVNLSAAGTFSAAGWTFTNWTEGGADIVSLAGTSCADTITGSSKADVIQGGLGADILSGGNGDDEFQYQSGGATGDVSVDGGSGNDRIRSTGSGTITNDFTTVSITSIEILEFGSSGTHTATFGGAQLGAGAIANVEGGAATTQALIVNGQTVNLSGVAFTNWGGANQTITINGTNATVNILFGSSQKDAINGTGSSADGMRGGGGADFLNGGGGDDSFSYTAAGDVAAGEVIFGSTGADTITLANAGSNDFSLATINSVETLDFESGNSTATFSSTQVGTGAIVTVSGSTGIDTFIVNAASNVDLSGVLFDAWLSGTDTITINGTASGETLTGSAQSDIIIGGDGADTMNGGGGLDIFQIAAGDFDAGKSIDGGTNTDTLRATGGVNFTNGTLLNLEGIAFSTSIPARAMWCSARPRALPPTSTCRASTAATASSSAAWRRMTAAAIRSPRRATSTATASPT